MTRQIKFRVWDNTNHRWEDDFGIYADGIIGDFSECFHNSAGKNGEYYTAQQFTGLIDKNGVDIYEGDIVVRSDTGIIDEDSVLYKDVVKFHPFITGWTGFNIGEDVSALDYSTYTSKVEVIGNVFENINLLKDTAWRKTYVMEWFGL